MSQRPLIVVLAWNEAACIGDTVGELLRSVTSADVVVVDDGSADETAARARAAGAKVVRHPFNLGVAAAEATGLRYALRHGYTTVLRMDGDGQHDPASVPVLVGALQAGADLVIGSRMLTETGFRPTGLRRVGHAFLSGLLSTLCHQRITDPTSGFRAFSRRAIELLGTHVPHDYPEPESVLLASRNGLRVTEVPVQMRARQAGTSSITAARAAFYMVKVSFALLLERLRPLEGKG